MLTSKQRSYLRGLSHDLNDIVLVGKEGVYDNVVKQADDALEAHELIKGKVLNNCFEKVKDIAYRIAEETGAEVVCTIGRKFILYRRNVKDGKIVLPR